ncbi:serine/threonine-protein phosphatase 7 long form homolog [Bidens hawaiensis]|uniref:serine/threonine-protein phosphatase 7 long form homolog n=1 Tax=Bidens hawaiensis TaxID=980011 RepID=UPI004049B908
MDSGLRIPKNEMLLLWFSEKWSPKTSSFILPWGEMTVTLEDLMVIGGFSVLGAPVTCQVESPEDHATSKSGKQNALEHPAFLAFWLSKYLFASVKDTVLPETFHLAILLARGRKIALAPAILATLYRDLHLLQDAIIDVLQKVRSDVVKVVFSPMCYVQAWIWERFSNVRPHAIQNVGETRLARWCRLDVAVNVGDLEDGTWKEYFLWRLYDTNHFISKSGYVKLGSWEEINTEEVESYARCLRACKLVGILDVMQSYSPHRICRQFGFPADILQIEDNENAWAEYFTPLTGSVYIPSRESKGQVSTRYEDWWEKEPVSPSNPRVPFLPKRRRKRVSAN